MSLIKNRICKNTGLNYNLRGGTDVLPLFCLCLQVGRGLRKIPEEFLRDEVSPLRLRRNPEPPHPTENLLKTHGIFGKICLFLLLKALICAIIY